MNFEQISDDVWIKILSNSNLSEPYFLISKSFVKYFSSAVSTKIKSFGTVSLNFSKVKIDTKLMFDKKNGWGLQILTNNIVRTFDKKYVPQNNLLIENNKILSVKKNVLTVHNILHDSIEIDTCNTPCEIKELFFLY